MQLGKTHQGSLIERNFPNCKPLIGKKIAKTIANLRSSLSSVAAPAAVSDGSVK